MPIFVGQDRQASRLPYGGIGPEALGQILPREPLVVAAARVHALRSAPTIAVAEALRLDAKLEVAVQIAQVGEYVLQLSQFDDLAG